jgi:hypothetical protein
MPQIPTYDLASPLDGTEELYIVKDSLSKKTTTQDIADLAGGGGGGSSDMLSVLVSAEIAISGAATATLSRMHKCVDAGSPADYTLALPTASGNAGKFIGVRISPSMTKFVTLDGNGSETIDLALTRVMWAGETAILMSDGSNWVKVAGRSIPMAGTLSLSATGQSISTGGGATTKLNLDIANASPSTMADAVTNHQLTIRRAGRYAIGGMLQFQLSTHAAAFALADVFLNGAQLVETYAESTGTLAPQIPGGLQVDLAVGDTIDLRAYQTTGSSQTCAGHATSLFTFVTATELLRW